MTARRQNTGSIGRNVVFVPNFVAASASLRARAARPGAGAPPRRRPRAAVAGRAAAFGRRRLWPRARPVRDALAAPHGLEAAAEHRVRRPRVALRRGFPQLAPPPRADAVLRLDDPQSFWVVLLLRLGQLLGRRGAVERINKNRRDGVVPRLIRRLLLALRPRLGLGAGLAPQDRVGLQERRAPVLRGGRVDVARRGSTTAACRTTRFVAAWRSTAADALVLAANIRDAAPPQTQRNSRRPGHGLALVDLPRRAGVVAAGSPRVLQAPDGLLHLEGLGFLRRAAQRLRRLVDELLLVADFALALFGHFLLGVCLVCYHPCDVCDDSVASPSLQCSRFGAAEIALMPTRLAKRSNHGHESLICQNERRVQTGLRLGRGGCCSLLVSYVPLAMASYSRIRWLRIWKLLLDTI